MSVILTGTHQPVTLPYYTAPNYLGFSFTEAKIKLYLCNDFKKTYEPWFYKFGSKDVELTWSIYKKDPDGEASANGEIKHFYETNYEPVRKIKMTKAAETGVYIATYPRIPGGNYVQFVTPDKYVYLMGNLPEGVKL